MRQNHSALTKKGLPLLLCTAILSAGMGPSAEAAQTQGGYCHDREMLEPQPMGNPHSQQDRAGAYVELRRHNQ